MYKIELQMVGTTVIHPVLQWVTILGVQRNGVGQTEVATTPVGRQFKYTNWEGKIEFDPNTDQAIVPDPTEPLGTSLEKIHVLYK